MARRHLIKGDKLRELILLVYLNSRYGLGKRIEISKLKQFLSYSTGGLYSALDSSGYFIRNGDEITLSAKGEEYVKKELLQRYRAFYPVCYFLIFFGAVLFVHWYLLTYHNVLLFFDWTIAIAFIVFGLLVRFALLPLAYWFLRFRKKV